MSLIEWILSGNKEKPDRPHACFCIGPQNGEPYCPCKMRQLGVFRRGDKWVVPEREIE